MGPLSLSLPGRGLLTITGKRRLGMRVTVGRRWEAGRPPQQPSSPGRRDWDGRTDKRGRGQRSDRGGDGSASGRPEGSAGGPSRSRRWGTQEDKSPRSCCASSPLSPEGPSNLAPRLPRPGTGERPDEGAAVGPLRPHGECEAAAVLGRARWGEESVLVPAGQGEERGAACWEPSCRPSSGRG